MNLKTFTDVQINAVLIYAGQRCPVNYFRGRNRENRVSGTRLNATGTVICAFSRKNELYDASMKLVTSCQIAGFHVVDL